MEPIAIVTAIFAALYIVGRGPLLIAPAATADFYRQTFSTPWRVRVLGGLLALLGVAAVVAAREADPTQRDVTIFIECLGWIAAVAALWPIVAAGTFQRLIHLFYSTPEEFLRSVGALNVVIGLVLGFVAFFVL